MACSSLRRSFLVAPMLTVAVAAAFGGCGPGDGPDDDMTAATDGGETESPESTEDTGTDRSTSSGAPDLSCEGEETPPTCVEIDGDGCLGKPVGDATCIEGAWACETPWQVPHTTDDNCAEAPTEGCAGDQPWCTDQTPPDCSDAQIDFESFCVEGVWSCPPGFHIDEGGRCDWSDEDGG